MSQPTRLAYGLVPLLGVLGEQRVPIEPLLAHADIPKFALEEPSYRIRLDQETQFTEAALACLKLPTPGIFVGKRYHLNSFGVLGLAALSAPSIFDLQRLLLSYPVLAWGMFECSIWRTAETGLLRLKPAVDLGACGEFFLTRDMVCAATIFRDAIGAAINPTLVCMQRPAPDDASAYQDVFRCPIRFNAADNELHFDHQLWQRTPLQANEMSFRFYEAQCRQISETFQGPLDYTDIVRSRLRSTTPIPALTEMASGLHLTERTLQRRLAAEGSRFAELLREVREERARQLLARKTLLMDEIAYRLGFRDNVAFSRAYKSWTGVSPSRHRPKG